MVKYVLNVVLRGILQSVPKFSWEIVKIIGFKRNKNKVDFFSLRINNKIAQILRKFTIY